ncbi:hypothetical protein LX73_2325 [Fodinibius salinus]|uniref:Uncharacterized protein n=1 Tax=Fodinibius salinus TaxID=860790 RepID=A0A5D3YG32_9BACT|nr:hypothetical protein [Fodinibius salinus]TYP92078.1 hypothetical protein LX73_2325 [Fodinibius salinus]
MGKLLGADIQNDDELGAAAAIATGAATLYNIGRNIFGGRDDCTAAKKKNEQKIRQLLQQFTTLQERKRFVQKFNALDRIGASPRSMARFWIGEDDCKHKNVSDNHQRYLDELIPWIQQKVKQKTNDNPLKGAFGDSAADILGGIGTFLALSSFAYFGYEQLKDKV